MNDTQLDFKFEAGNNKKYTVDGIWDSAVYAKKLAGQLSGIYYLVLKKSYLKEKNTWEPALAIQYFQRFVTAYHKNNSEKSTTISTPVNTALLMARPTASLIVRLTMAPTKKRGRFVKSTTINKRAKKS